MGKVPGRDDEDLWAVITEMRREIRDLAAASRLSSAAIGEGGIEVYGSGSIRSSDFDGTGPEDPGTAGWWLGGANAGAVFNQLALRDGIIGNDALTNPVSFGLASGFDFGFATQTTDVAYAAQTIAVPAGFSQALVTCNAYVGAYNGSGAFDYLYVQARIGTTDAGEIPVSVDDGSFRGSHATKVLPLSGLDGGGITVAAVAHTQNAPWAAISSRAYVEATAIFIR